MTDTNPVEAHVQVLTAEVRTLVVGSRQVTMSVYSQLDNVPPDDIEPFDRVSPKSKTGLFLFVVGRHRVTGALVRSYIPRRPESLDDKGWLPSGPGERTSYRHWTPPSAWPDVDAIRRRQKLPEIAARWSALPLIVLAGLR